MILAAVLITTYLLYLIGQEVKQMIPKKQKYYILCYSSGDLTVYSSVLNDKESEDLMISWSQQGLSPRRAFESVQREELEDIRKGLTNNA